MSRRAPEVPGRNTRDRILAVASHLFYVRGYANTGIRQIVDEAKTVAASFYDHFPSKEDLGIAYLNREVESMESNLSILMARSRDLNTFASLWTAFIKQQIRKGEFNGCAFAGFAYQVPVGETKFHLATRKATGQILGLLSKYVESVAQATGLKPGAATEQLAIELFTAYEGYAALWKLTGNVKMISQMKNAFLSIVSRY